MGREKVIEKVSQEVQKSLNPANLIMQYAPIVIGLICLVVCYLLFKKFQSLNAQNENINKLEKQFTGFMKEQSEVNTVNAKRFNAVMSQMNQLSFVVQNSNVRETNSMDSQMSPMREQERQNVVNKPVEVNTQQNLQQQIQEQQHVNQPPQRELMPTSVISTSYPVKGELNSLPIPISTTTKKETENVINQVENDSVKKEKNSKKVIDLQQVKEEVLIEEASSDDDE